MTRIGDWIQTYSGRQFFPLDPRADEIHIEDVAHSLSLQCRYAGHCRRFYSVAEHSVHLARFVSAPNKLWALLHDASEAYLVDVPRPVKPALTGYKGLEQCVMLEIAIRFNLSWPMPQEVHDADMRICVDEKAQNMAPGLMWGIDGLEPLGITLPCWMPQRAEREFLKCFRELTTPEDLAVWRAERGEALA
jgi:hypothetical protein